MKAHRGSRSTLAGRKGIRVVMGLTGPRRSVVAPPAVAEGRARCPVCRNTPLVLASGHLRSHRDLFGHQCYNVAPAKEEHHAPATP